MFNQQKESSSSSSSSDDDTYYAGPLGRVSAFGGYVTDIFSSAQDKIYNASEEASKQIYGISNGLTSKVYSALNVSQQQPQSHRPILITESAPTTNQVVTNNKPNFAIPSSSSFSSSRKWFMVDPYHIVTGRMQFLPTHHRDSVNAVRNLLQFVDVHDASDESKPVWQDKRMKVDMYKGEGSDSFDSEVSTGIPEVESTEDFNSNMNVSDSSTQSSHTGYRPKKKNRQISKAVTASRLGEGTIRAMRDMALSEALELHNALRFWTERLERPFLYYLESGPSLWVQKGIDHHSVVGEKVSQLQAVLARRCSSIGELQQHLWRAGWQSGVENWGILGQGEWAAVVGNHGSMRDDNHHMLHKIINEKEQRRKIKSSEFFQRSIQTGSEGRHVSSRNNEYDYYTESHLFVKNVRGGEIVSNDSALAAWSIDAIRVVRDQLYSAGNGLKALPYYKNWPKERRHFDESTENSKEHAADDDQHRTSYRKDSDIDRCDGDGPDMDIPRWAIIGVERDLATNSSFSEKSSNKLSSSLSETILEQEKESLPNTCIPQPPQSHEKILISNLGLMAAEVTEILNSMENYMYLQRKRRLEKLRPPSRIHRNWYVAAIGIPALAYIGLNLIRGNKGTRLAREAYLKILSFCSEHISEPLKSIYRELFTRKGRKDVTDRKARDEVILVLRKMIKSWLDEVHPDMPENERVDKAQNMDMSLIENTKEDSIKNIFEIHNIYRLSLIEMQFIKKEMMNALFAMDELMGSNEINIKLAAMTPAFLLASFARYFFRKLFYALLKIGKSREETYTQFRHIVLDIERLLVMRDNPPSSPPPLPNGVKNLCTSNQDIAYDEELLPKANALSPDDLGMLMLLVHECRVILWQDRRRFTRSELRNVSEDLAELAGERGAVSVQQQLRIIARMCRTYSFLKVISSGIPFSVES
jgi:ATP synthase regulation protein NCA2.